jgi:CRP/FNR family transcriptional regulator, putaive post-exponential-phase nitrogen-starvation regulator
VRILNKALLSQYFETYHIDTLFDHDPKPELLLFEFQKDDMVLYAGTHADYIYLLVEGKVKVFNYSHDGKTIFLTQLKPFQILGETATLWGWEATANVQAMITSHCIGIDLLQYRELLLNSVPFLNFLCQNMAIKLALQNKYFSNTIHDSLEIRLAALILSRSDKQVFQPNLTEYAEFLGTSYRHLLRTMRKFNERGILRKQGRSYLILNSDALKQIANAKTH